MNQAGMVTDRAKNSMLSFSNAARGMVAGVSIAQGGVGSLIGIWLAMSNPLLGAVAAMTAFGVNAVKARAGMEVAEVGLENIFQDAEAANWQLNKLVEFAAKTPFELKGLVKSHQMLLAYQFTAEETLTWLRAIGDTVASRGTFNAQELDQLVRALGRLRAGGSPGEAFESLSRFGITQQQLKEYGIKIGTGNRLESPIEDVLDAIFQLMTDRYGGMMDELSRTVSGKFSNLKDAAFQAFADMGTSLEPAMKGFLDWLIKSLENIAELFHLVFDSHAFHMLGQSMTFLMTVTEQWRSAFSGLLKLMGAAGIHLFHMTMVGISRVVDWVTRGFQRLNARVGAAAALFSRATGPLKAVYLWLRDMWQALKNMDWNEFIQSLKDLAYSLFGEDSWVFDVAEAVINFFKTRIEFAEKLTLEQFLTRFAIGLAFATAIGKILKIRFATALLLMATLVFRDPSGENDFSDAMLLTALAAAMTAVSYFKKGGGVVGKKLSFGVGAALLFFASFEWRGKDGKHIVTNSLIGSLTTALVAGGLIAWAMRGITKGMAFKFPTPLGMMLGVVLSLLMPKELEEALGKWVRNVVERIRLYFTRTRVEDGDQIIENWAPFEVDMAELFKLDPNWFETLGVNIGKLATDGIEILTDALRWFKDHPTVLRNLALGIGALVAVKIVSGIGAFAMAMPGMIGAIYGLGGAAKTWTTKINLLALAVVAVVTALSDLKDWTEENNDKVNEILGTVPAKGPAIDLEQQAADELWRISNEEGWLASAERAGEAWVAAFQQTFEGVGGVFDALGTLAQDIWTIFKEALSIAWDEVVKPFLTGRKDAFIETMRNAGEGVVSTVMWLYDTGKEIVASLLTGLDEIWRTKVAPFLRTSKVRVLEQIAGKNYRVNSATWLYTIGYNIIRGLADGMRNAWKANVVPLLSTYSGEVASSMKSSLGISSPSQVFMDIGEDIMSGLAQGMSHGYGSNVAPAMSTAMSGIVRSAPSGGGGGGNTFNITIGSVDSRERVREVEEALARATRNALGGDRRFHRVRTV